MIKIIIQIMIDFDNDLNNDIDNQWRFLIEIPGVYNDRIYILVSIWVNNFLNQKGIL